MNTRLKAAGYLYGFTRLIIPLHIGTVYRLISRPCLMTVQFCGWSDPIEERYVGQHLLGQIMLSFGNGNSFRDPASYHQNKERHKVPFYHRGIPEVKRPFKPGRRVHLSHVQRRISGCWVRIQMHLNTSIRMLMAYPAPVTSTTPWHVFGSVHVRSYPTCFTSLILLMGPSSQSSPHQNPPTLRGVPSCAWTTAPAPGARRGPRRGSPRRAAVAF